MMLLKWLKKSDCIEASQLFKLVFLLIIIFNVNLLFSFNSIAFFSLQNNLKDKKLYWLGRGISESLRDSIFSDEDYIIDSKEMEKMYEQIGLSQNMDLTYATIIKIASLNNVNYVFIGSLDSNEENDKKIQIQTKIINVATLDTFSINIESELKDIVNVQAKLAEIIIDYFNKIGIKLFYYKDLFDNISAFSFEMYIKGLQEKQPEKAIKFFKQALKENKSFPIANLKLAESYYQLEDYDKALEYLSNIKSDSSLFYIALFNKANLLAIKKDFNAALQNYLEVSKYKVASSLFNNIAVCLIYQGNLQHSQWYLKQALTIYPDDLDLIFNQAILYILMDDLKKAKETIISFINNNPRNLAGHLVLNYIAENSNESFFADYTKEMAEKFGKFSAFKEKFKNDFKELLRLQFNFNEEQLKKYKRSKKKDEIVSIISALNGYKARIKESIENKEYNQCMDDMEKAALLAPYDWELFYLRAKFYWETKDLSKAEFFAKLSLWCKENNETLQLLEKLK